jgi:osmotically inducible lipoprotein OsmB
MQACSTWSEGLHDNPPQAARPFAFAPTKEMDMKIRTGSSLAAAALLSLALTGCASHPTNAQIGTGVGAIAGGVVGDAVFGSTLGTVGGAAAGALIGNEVGKRNDRRY